MRKPSIYVLMFSAILLAGSVIITACGSGQKSEATEEPAAESAEESTASEEVAYACPMHPDITGKEGDTCSKCGMDLELVEDDAESDSSEVSED